jgi:hypothetical protein
VKRRRMRERRKQQRGEGVAKHWRSNERRILTVTGNLELRRPLRSGSVVMWRPSSLMENGNDRGRRVDGRGEEKGGEGI